jgi:hypothetical protein
MSHLMSLSGVKQTWPTAVQMSAFDPKRTSASVAPTPSECWRRLVRYPSWTSGEAMRRRDFIKGIACSAVAWPIPARAQQTERMRRVGVLMHSPSNEPEAQARLAAFLRGMQDAGWGGRTQFKHRISLERGRPCTSVQGCERIGHSQSGCNLGRCRWDHGCPPASNPCRSDCICPSHRSGR